MIVALSILVLVYREHRLLYLFFYLLSLNLLKYGKEAGGTALNASNE